MFDPKTSNCSATNCSLDSTPCPQRQWSEGYPAYGLDGASYEGYSYKTNTGFESKLKTAEDGKYYIEDQINQWTHDGQPITMYKGVLESAKTVSYLLYDSEDLNKLYDSEASGGINMQAITFKSINNMDIGLAPDGQSYVWGEYLPERPVMYIVRDENAPTLTFLLADKTGNPIDFNHPKYKDLVNVNDRVSVKRNDIDSCDAGTKDCCSDYIVRAVVAKGTSTFNGKEYPAITLEGGNMNGEPEKLTFKGRNGFGGNAELECLNNADKYVDGVYPGDEVRFEFSSFDPCNPMLGGYQVQGHTMKQSNIQYIGKEVCFDWAELRKGYSAVGGISAVLGRAFSAISRDFAEQQARTFWLGENRKKYNAAGVPGSTMGWLTEMFAAHANKPYLKLIRSAASAVTLDEKALMFMETLMQVQQSKWSGPNPLITVVMDDKAIATFYALRKSFKNLGGWIEMLPDAKKMDYSQLPEIITPYGKMEILTDTFLKEIYGNSGVCVFMDKNLLGARQTEEFEVELPSNNVTRKATTGFKVKDVTDPKVIGCKCWYVWTSFAYIFIGIGQEASPFAILEGFSV